MLTPSQHCVPNLGSEGGRAVKKRKGSVKRLGSFRRAYVRRGKASMLLFTLPPSAPPPPHPRPSTSGHHHHPPHNACEGGDGREEERARGGAGRGTLPAFAQKTFFLAFLAFAFVLFTPSLPKVIFLFLSVHNSGLCFLFDSVSVRAKVPKHVRACDELLRVDERTKSWLAICEWHRARGASEVPYPCSLSRSLSLSPSCVSLCTLMMMSLSLSPPSTKLLA